MASIFNEENLLAEIAMKVNQEMMKAAEPIIQKAIEDAEKDMRKQLGAMLIGLINQSFSMTRHGTIIEIRLDQGKIR